MLNHYDTFERATLFWTSNSISDQGMESITFNELPAGDSPQRWAAHLGLFDLHKPIEQNGKLAFSNWLRMHEIRAPMHTQDSH